MTTAPAGRAASAGAGRAAWVGAFERDLPTDLFLDTAGWGSGFAFVNGFFLGRYDRTGPQRTLYVPAPVVRAGENTVVALELADAPRAVARFVADADLGPLEE